MDAKKQQRGVEYILDRAGVVFPADYVLIKIPYFIGIKTIEETTIVTEGSYSFSQDLDKIDYNSKNYSECMADRTYQKSIRNGYIFYAIFKS